MNATVLTYLGLVTLASVIGGVVLAGMGIPASAWAWLPTTVATGVGALAGIAIQGNKPAEGQGQP